MSPSSGKASGKIACDWPHDAELQNAYKRIAQLEAELASERTLAETAWRANADLVAANEKAEAEVERLKKVLSFAIQVLDEYEPEWREPMEEELKGGGRESGASDRAGDGASQLPDRTTAHVSAAEPAARKERDEG